jgi:hypothetical protein
MVTASFDIELQANNTGLIIDTELILSSVGEQTRDSSVRLSVTQLSVLTVQLTGNVEMETLLSSIASQVCLNSTECDVQLAPVSEDGNRRLSVDDSIVDVEIRTTLRDGDQVKAPVIVEDELAASLGGNATMPEQPQLRKLSMALTVNSVMDGPGMRIALAEALGVPLASVSIVDMVAPPSPATSPPPPLSPGASPSAAPSPLPSPSLPPAAGLRLDNGSALGMTIALVAGGLTLLLVIGLLVWYRKRHPPCHVAVRKSKSKSRNSTGSSKMSKANSMPGGLDDDDLEKGRMEQVLSERLVDLGLSPNTVELALGSSFTGSPSQRSSATAPTPTKAKSTCCVEGTTDRPEKARATPIYHTAEANFFANRERPTTDLPSLPVLPLDLQSVSSPMMAKHASSHM